MKIQMAQKQRTILSQRMQLSANILQMGIAELEEYLKEFSLENPVVELEVKKEGMSDFERQNFSPPSNDIPDFQNLAQSNGESLYEYLLYQLMGMKLEKKQEWILKQLIWNLNEDGYLLFSDNELSESLGIAIEDVCVSIELLQQMDPAGVGARSLQECLLWQARKRTERVPDLERIIIEYLPDVANRRYGKLGKEMGLSEKRVRELCTMLLSLNPRPGNGFASLQMIPIIYPDFYVVEDDGEVEVLLNDSYQPFLNISNYYNAFLANPYADLELKCYLSEKKKQAEWIIKCIDQRKKTSKKCVETIVEIQAGFFTLKETELRPMTLKEIAQRLSISESTVSRALKNKYLKCKKGIFPLNFFLSATVGENKDHTQKTILSAIKIIVDKEDKHAPLSDKDIAVSLAKQGIYISRRTVAKYRDLLRILPSFQRKLSENS